MKTLLTSFLLALATAGPLLQPSASSPVLDFEGNPVTTRAAYTIRRRGTGFFGGLTLLPLNGSSCARHAAFSDVEVDRGIPVAFQLFWPGTTLEPGHGNRFRVRFLSAPCCARDGEWTVDGNNEYVTAGGDGGDSPSYFAVLPEEDGGGGEGGYTLGYCGPCALCKNGCRRVDTDDDLFLKLQDDRSLELKVDFVVANGYVSGGGGGGRSSSSQ